VRDVKSPFAARALVDVNGNEQLTQLLPYHAIQVRRENPSARDVIVPLVKQLVRGTTEKVIVFRKSMRICRGMRGLSRVRGRSSPCNGCSGSATQLRFIVAYGLPRASHLGQNEGGNEAHRIVASLRS
jgi:hypothetical protein